MLLPRPRLFLVSIAALTAVSLMLWAFGNGIPYGYDGMEIYFTYLIGFNAATFSHVNPLLADLAASPDPVAHPYYYTHHPNLVGHLLSQFLIRAGARDLRLHCLASIVLLIAGVWLGGRTLSTMVGFAEANAYVMISAMHYVGVLSWGPVLLRSLHFLFFWGAIALTHRYLTRPTLSRLLMMAAWTYVVFLNDYTMGPWLLIIQLVAVWIETSWRTFVRVGAALALAA